MKRLTHLRGIPWQLAERSAAAAGRLYRESQRERERERERETESESERESTWAGAFLQPAAV